MISEEDIANCHYVPMSTMQKVVEAIETPMPKPDKRCKRNLLQLQVERSVTRTTGHHRDKRWLNMFQMAVSRAIYSHDWNKLLFLLKKSPIWENSELYDELSIYVRALTILLMNHPIAQSRALYNDFQHMVLSARSENDKRAVIKVIMSLQQKIAGRS